MRSAFTLIELLVVIAVLSILVVVVVLTLNPAGLLQESRDSNRISDMATLNSGISLFVADVQTPNALGSANIVYVSIPDAAATSSAGDQCQGLNLLTLPGGYTYHCASPSLYRKTDGTGWLPLNFASATFASPFSQLPIDPTNTSSSRLYYTYTTNGVQYEVTSVMESAKYQLGGSSDVITPDGGTLATVYEKGSRLGLEPLDYGDPTLVGYWTFDEGSGGTAFDYSGVGDSATLVGPTAWTSGKIGSGAFTITPSSNRFIIPSSTALNTMALQNTVTFSAWINVVASAGGQDIFGGADLTPCAPYKLQLNSGSPALRFQSYSGSCGSYVIDSSSQTVPISQWIFIAATYGGGTLKFYINGVLTDTIAETRVTNSVNSTWGIGYVGNTYFNGSVDDLRAYNRVLSASQIADLYTGGK